MSWIENILIIAGISLDIFAAMEIEGAMLADVKRKSLMIASTIVTVLQLIFFFGGYFVCYELEKHQIIQNAEEIGYIVATVVFALLGIRLIVKANLSKKSAGMISVCVTISRSLPLPVFIPCVPVVPAALSVHPLQ